MTSADRPDDYMKIAVNEHHGPLSTAKTILIDGILIGIMTDGEIECDVNATRYHIERNMSFLMLPHQIMTLLSSSPNTHLWWVYVPQSLIKKIPIPNLKIPIKPDIESQINALVELRSFRLNPESVSEMVEVLTILRRRLQSELDTENHMLHFSLLASAVLMARSGSSEMLPALPHTSRKATLSRQFLSLLVTDVVSHHQVSYYADKLCVTPKYLSASVTAATRRSPHDWIATLLVIEAKRRLTYTSDPVTDIAFDLNFASDSTFVRFFRQQTGVTPHEFRNKKL